MKFLNQKFEYITYRVDNSSFEDLEKEEKLVWQKEYNLMLLNALGVRGWELISLIDDTFKEDRIKVDRLTFKRSSRSEYFGSGWGVDTIALKQLAKKQVKE
jgi:hypothetical protein